MAKLSVRHIGPIKEIDINLNRVNVFIGPQSSGKSTLAKLISFFNWLEKDCVLHQDIDRVNRQFLEETLISYHNLQDYFSPFSKIIYEGNALIVHLTDLITFSEGSIIVKKADSFSNVELSKNAYIPSERNMLGVPGIFSIKMPKNYLLEFIDDWQEIRRTYFKETQLTLLNLGDTYFFSEKDNSDRIILNSGKEIRFSQASSGLQSVTPLCVCIDYLTQWIYTNEENRSAEERKRYRDVIQTRLLADYQNIIKGRLTNDILTKLNEPLTYESIDNIMPELVSIAQNLRLQYRLTHPAATNLVVEEPEQNLFPETQVKLVYYMLSKLEHRALRDSLVVTTHSPYILYALNNCMLAALTGKENEPIIEAVTSVPKNAWIDPRLVSVWELSNGRIRDKKTIQDERGLIRGNYFDRVMRNLLRIFCAGSR